MADFSFMLRAIPQYSGVGEFSAREARTFILKLDSYINVADSTKDTASKLSDLEKVSMLISYLQGNAGNWVASQIQNQDFMKKPWEEARELFLQAFSPHSDFDTQTVADEYNSLKQRGNVETYSERFETLRLALPNNYESVSATKDRYLQGLSESLAYMVAVRRPTDEMEAKQYAKEIEAYQLFNQGKLLRTKTSNTKYINPSFYGNRSQYGYEPMELDSMNFRKNKYKTNYKNYQERPHYFGAQNYNRERNYHYYKGPSRNRPQREDYKENEQKNGRGQV